MPRPTKQEAAKTGKKSNAKGKRGERYARDFFKQHGFHAHRGRQYSGNADAPDVVTDLDWLHTEVKFVEKLNISLAYAQSKRDASTANPEKIPIVFHKKTREVPLITLSAHDFLGLVELLEEYRDNPISGITDPAFLLERVRRSENYFGDPESDKKTDREEKIAEIEERLKDRKLVLEARDIFS